MLSHDEFIDYVEKNVRDYLPDELQDAEIMIHHVVKNNGMDKAALIVRAKDNPVSPTIYLDPFYEQYKEHMSLDFLVEQIARTSAMHQVKPDMFGSFLDNYLKFDDVKSRIVMQVINREKNDELLSTIPYIPHEDLAMVYRVMVSIDGEESGSVLINNEMASMWGVTAEDLDYEARINSPILLPATCKTMTETLMDMMDLDGIDPEMFGMEPPEMEVPMYVITNDQKVNGASALFYSDKLPQLSDRLGENLFVLPSSIHEVLVLPESAANVEELAEMVRTVNATEVSAEEQLSDHVYFFDAKEQTLKLADTSWEEIEKQKATAEQTQTAAEKRSPFHR